MSHFKVVEDIKQLLDKVKPLFELADALEKIGSVEQAEASATMSKEKAYKELEDAKLEVANKLAELESIKQDMASVSKAIEESKAYGENMKLEIKAACDKEFADGQKKLQEFKVEADGQKELMLAGLEFIKSEVKNHKLELEDSKAQVEDIKGKLAAFIKG